MGMWVGSTVASTGRRGIIQYTMRFGRYRYRYNFI